MKKRQLSRSWDKLHLVQADNSFSSTFKILMVIGVGLIILGFIMLIIFLATGCSSSGYTSSGAKCCNNQGNNCYEKLSTESGPQAAFAFMLIFFIIGAFLIVFAIMKYRP